jgi:hypothetical protein
MYDYKGRRHGCDLGFSATSFAGMTSYDRLQLFEHQRSRDMFRGKVWDQLEILILGEGIKELDELAARLNDYDDIKPFERNWTPRLVKMFLLLHSGRQCGAYRHGRQTESGGGYPTEISRNF